MQSSLLDSKKEYIDIILDNVSIPICNIIYNIYKSCANAQEFQQKLTQIKHWNNHIISEHSDIVINSCENNSLIGKLLKEIIIINIKLKVENKKIDYKKVPIINIVDFIHKCLINSGVFCWKNAYLFSHKNLKQSEKQYHLNLIEKNIRKIIKITIRDCTPLDLILDELLFIEDDDEKTGGEEESGEEEDDDEESGDEEEEDEESGDEEEEDEESGDDDEDEESEKEEAVVVSKEENKKEEIKLGGYDDEEEVKEEEVKIINIDVNNNNELLTKKKNKPSTEELKEEVSDDDDYEEEENMSNDEEVAANSSDDDETEYKP
uniref:Uncharacterized protein n=1 Tax=viral metagenome TaxID=1070528 RepID=A0A6C0LI83_9ZZZZ